MDFNWLKNVGELFRGRRKVTLDDLQKAHQVARELGDWLRNVLPLGPEIMEHLTYSQALSYFVEHRPQNQRIVKGAMLLQPHAQGRLLVQVFLDHSNELVCGQDGKPFGRRVVVRRLDEELLDTFGGKDLVIVE
ncbi:MAG TPA: hypothetical protein VEU33_37610 [Archangium sp.]|nr:hypothetical protein [Archangium sp.]